MKQKKQQDVAEMLHEHTKQDDIRFNEVINGQSEIKGDIKVIKENHLAHIQVDLATQTTNVAWIMKFMWVVIGASVTAMATGFITLLISLHK